MRGGGRRNHREEGKDRGKVRGDIVEGKRRKLGKRGVNGRREKMKEKEARDSEAV